MIDHEPTPAVEPTPRPWHCERQPAGHLAVFGPRGGLPEGGGGKVLVALLYPTNRPFVTPTDADVRQCLANAELVARAANAFDGLLSALETAALVADLAHGHWDADRMHAALKAARGVG